jgi:hypothetical protein
MRKDSILGVPSDSRFQVSCDAGEAGRFRADTDSVSVTVGQRIRRQGTQEMWASVAVEGKQEQDGTLVVRVLVSNPDWDERLQIACIRSRPDDPECLTALGTNLDHIGL